MGRAMLIICAGTLIAMGFVAMGTAQQGERLTQKNVGYAEFIQAKNAAHTAIQVAMEEISDDENWAHSHDSTNKWTDTIEGSSIELYVDYIHDADPGDYWMADSIRIVSKASFEGAKDIKVESVYLKNAIDYVPNFEGALTLATDYFDFMGNNGNTSIDGTEASGTCSDDAPGVAVMDEASKTKVENNSSKVDLTGDPPIGVKSGLSYQPTDELIARLKDHPATQKISGNYGGNMGSEDNPGIFLVEDEAKLNGKTPDGYGILIIRTEGDLTLVDDNGAVIENTSDGAEITINGNFKFHGLVIFENAYNFKGRGTPDLHGSVLVGHTQEYLDKAKDDPSNYPPMPVDLSGNISMKYDCQAENYAKMAAAQSIGGNRFRRVVTYE